MKNSLIAHYPGVAVHTSQSRFAKTVGQLVSTLILVMLVQANSPVCLGFNREHLAAHR